MSNILRRPMFKLGGQSSDGVGITSGFRKGYNTGGNEWMEEIDWNNLGGSKGIYETMGKAIGPTMEAMKGAGKMDNYDLAMLISNVAGKGGSIYDMVTDAQTQVMPYADRYKKAQASMGPAAFNMLGTMGGLAAKSEAANRESDREFRVRMNAKADQMLVDTTFEALSEADQSLYEGLKKVALGTGFLTDSEAFVVAIKTAPDVYGKEWRDLDDEDKRNFINKLKGGIQTGTLPSLDTLAQGGRVGLQQSYPGTVEEASMAEQIQTPGGVEDITETEEITETPPPAQDPYVLLRARLPKEISDDVVRLIAYNPEAFKDFAAIENQEDVMAFNQTYGVELVLPAQPA